MSNWVNVKRIVRNGLTSVWRNTFVSLSAVLVMTITLIVIGFVIFVGAILDSSLEEIKSKVDVNVYFVTDAPEEEILSLKLRLETLPEVALVEYISREEALENFRERHGDDQLMLQAIDELDENPLGAILNIRAQETNQYETIADFLEGDTALSDDDTSISIIDSVNFLRNKLAIERLSKIVEAAETLGIVISAVLAVVSVVISFNTIRLVIYTSREEISVMRLVGASYGYIRGPFVVSGIFYGVLASVITMALFYPFVLWLGPTTEAYFGGINVFDYYVSNFGQLFLVLLLSGVVLGGFSSFLAVKRYLKI